MALTYEDIIARAEQIRTNELPESNTADLVGQLLKDTMAYFHGREAEAGTKDDEQDRTLAELSVLCDTLSATISELSGRMDTSSGYLEGLRGELDTLKVEVSSLKVSTYNLWSNLIGIRGKIDEMSAALEDKQEKLVSGVSLKTVNGESLLGSGDVSAGGGATVPAYAAFDFATLREKIGSGRTQGDLDAFGLTDEVWTGIRAGETMVIRDDQRERTYIVTGSSDYYISFAYGMGEAYEGWEIRSSGDSFTITVGYTQGGGGTGGAVTIE